MNEADPTLYWVLVMTALGAVWVVAGVAALMHRRLAAPPVPKLARSEWFAYRVLLKTRRRRRLYWLALVGILSGCVGQAVVGLRHVGWGETALVAGRGLALALAIVIALQIGLTVPDDPYALHKPLDPPCDDIAPAAEREALRLLLLKLVAWRLLIAVVVLLLGVWLRFGLTLEPFVVWLGLLTVLYVLGCVGEIGSRRLWRATVVNNDDERDENG